jgi:acetyl esterase
MKLHPQVAALLEAAARSPLPTLDKVSPFVARRLYAERCKTVMPKKVPEVQTRLLLTPSGVAIRAYRPAGVAKTDLLPALVYFHGGGWTIGDLDTHDVVCRTLADLARCAVASVDYRLAPEHKFPAAVDDAVAATRWVAREAGRLGLDARRIAVGGDSAGGNLAAVVALAARDEGGPPLAMQTLIYPATDMAADTASHLRYGEGHLLTRDAILWFRANYLRDAADEADWRASPLKAADLSRLPPAYVITAGSDPLVDEGRAYADRLQAAGVPVTYECFEGMVHGFVTMGGAIAAAHHALARCAQGLRLAFARPPR